jgi:hypothetical protein
MAWDDLARQAIEENKADRDRLISVWIGVLAVLLAICGMGGSNATKEATLKNIEAANTWSFFQAKNTKRELYRIEAEQLKFQIMANPQIPEAARIAISDKIKSLEAADALLSSDLKKGEGLEKERDLAMKRDPYFDYGTAFLQIAIVLASVAIISQGSILLVGSALVGLLGAFMTANGYLQFAALPFIN